MRVDVISRPDWATRKANDLAVLFHRRSIGNLGQGDLVAGADVLIHADAHRRVLKFITRFDGTLQYRDAVGLPQQNGHIMEISLRH